MIPEYRQAFNANFSAEKYQRFLEQANLGYPAVPFRLAESPFFIPAELKQKLIFAGEQIIDFIKDPNFKALTQNAIPKNWWVPNENDHPHFLSLDFGIYEDENGEISPMLIEMQGFPSLYGFQNHLANHYKDAYALDKHLTPFFNELNEAEYFNLLRKVIVGNVSPKQVVLMDVDAFEQATTIDFLISAEKLGIKVLQLTDIKREGKSLYYYENNEKIKIKRIYNRLIFDEVAADLSVFEQGFDPREELDVEWITHPNWFYRVSKYTMPYLSGKYVPKTIFLNEISEWPANLQDYVLKPLFSFAGSGVIIDITPRDIATINDPENWILQRKVDYEPVLKSPNGGVKVELRLMYLWPDGEDPKLCINLTRLSRGKMIGVRYNSTFDWVGGTVGLMP